MGNYNTPHHMAINALMNRDKIPVMEAGGWSENELRLIQLVTDIIDGVLEGERMDLRHLRVTLPATIRNTPHSCQTEEHCCALHAAHAAAAEKVIEVLEYTINKVGKDHYAEVPA